MITHLKVENFKCLQQTEVELGAFTVLIGANDSGKSSILDAIHVLGRTTRESLEASLKPEDDANGNSAFDHLVWRRYIARQIRLIVRGVSDSKKFEYYLWIQTGPGLMNEGLNFDGKSVDLQNSGRPRHLTGIAFATQNNVPLVSTLKLVVPGFASTGKYRLDPRALRRVLPLQSKPALTSSGDNLAEALDAIISGPDRSAIQRLEANLHEAVPTLRGIALRTVRPDGATNIGKALEFTLANTTPPITVPASNASEGALLLTGYLALAYGETPEILLVEEPENGLHPTRLETVISLLRKMSTGEIGNRPRQVILTTHSPLLLNYVKPEEVRIVRRDPDEGTKVTSMTAVPNLDAMLKEFAIGELWYLLTEEGLLKGQKP